MPAAPHGFHLERWVLKNLMQDYLAPSVKMRARGSPIKRKHHAMNPLAPAAYAQPNSEKQLSREPLEIGLLSKIGQGRQERNLGLPQRAGSHRARQMLPEQLPQRMLLIPLIAHTALQMNNNAILFFFPGKAGLFCPFAGLLFAPA